MLKRHEPEYAVLFVCLGNICRSPMAEGAFRQAAESAGLDFRVDSAGTASYHIGDPPDRRAIAVARSHGVDISGALGRKICPQDFNEYSHIFALDKANLTGIKVHAPRDSRAKVALLMDAVPGREGEGVKDPYYGVEADFAAAWDDISLAVENLVKQFQNESASVSR